MRVHPSILAPKASKWQWTAVMLVIVVVSAMGVLRGPEKVVVTQAPSPVEPRIEVLVAREAINPGEPLDRAKFVLESRPVNTLSADAITNFDQIKDKVAAGPIPAGYPLAKALLAETVAIVPVSDGIDEESLPVDPIEAMLKEIESDTVAIPVQLGDNPPKRGARIVITVSNGSRSAVIAEDAWVSETKDRSVTVRVDPDKALLLQALKSTDYRLSFIEIQIDGKSPFEGKGVTSLEELRTALQTGQPVNAKKENSRKVRGYAWVTGSGEKFALDEDGGIRVIGGE